MRTFLTVALNLFRDFHQPSLSLRPQLLQKRSVVIKQADARTHVVQLEIVLNELRSWSLLKANPTANTALLGAQTSLAANGSRRIRHTALGACVILLGTVNVRRGHVLDGTGARLGATDSGGGLVRWKRRENGRGLRFGDVVQNDRRADGGRVDVDDRACRLAGPRVDVDAGGQRGVLGNVARIYHLEHKP